MYQSSYKVELEVHNSSFSNLNDKMLFMSTLTNNHFGNLIHINQCIMTHAHHEMFRLQSREGYLASCSGINHRFKFTNCKFFHNHMHITDDSLIYAVYEVIDVEVKNCIFNNGKFKAISLYSVCFKISKILISSTTFSSINCTYAFIEALEAPVHLRLDGPVIFTKINKLTLYFSIGNHTHLSAIRE